MFTNKKEKTREKEKGRKERGKERKERKKEGEKEEIREKVKKDCFETTLRVCEYCSSCRHFPTEKVGSLLLFALRCSDRSMGLTPSTVVLLNLVPTGTRDGPLP